MGSLIEEIEETRPESEALSRCCNSLEVKPRERRMLLGNLANSRLFVLDGKTCMKVAHEHAQERDMVLDLETGLLSDRSNDVEVVLLPRGTVVNLKVELSA